MKRLIFVAVAFLVGCNGMGSGANRFLPASPGGADSAASVSQAVQDGRRGEKTKVHLTMTIPKRHRRDEARNVHPSTISSLTQSVSIAVNGGGAAVYNATPSSAACHVTAGGTVCTFVVNAPVGSDTFVIATYSSVGGGGTKLDQGSAVFNVVRGKNNAPSIRLGPVVTNSADAGHRLAALRDRRGESGRHDHAAASRFVDDRTGRSADRFKSFVDRGSRCHRERSSSRQASRRDVHRRYAERRRYAADFCDCRPARP